MNESNKKNAQNMYQAGVEFFEKGNFGNALKSFKDVLKLDPGKELKSKTQSMLTKLSLDKVELGIGLAAFILLSSLYVWFGILR